MSDVSSLDQEILSPEELHKFSEAGRDLCRKVADAVSNTLAELRPALVNGLMDKGWNKFEAQRAANRVLRPYRHMAGELNSAAVGAMSGWRAYQREIGSALATRKRPASGRTFKIPEKSG